MMTGSYRTCAIDAVLRYPPAEHVRGPNVPPESPTLGLTHLQFEAIQLAQAMVGQWTYVPANQGVQPFNG